MVLAPGAQFVAVRPYTEVEPTIRIAEFVSYPVGRGGPKFVAHPPARLATSPE